MAKKQRHQQAALWEFVQTELIYINKLKIIKDVGCHSTDSYYSDSFSAVCIMCFYLSQVVIAALVNLNQHDLLQEVSLQSIQLEFTGILHIDKICRLIFHGSV